MDGGSMPTRGEWKVMLDRGFMNVITKEFPDQHSAETYFGKKRHFLWCRILASPDGEVMYERGVNCFALKGLKARLRSSHTVARSTDAFEEARCLVTFQDSFNQAATEGDCVCLYWTSKVQDMPTGLKGLLQEAAEMPNPEAGEMLAPVHVKKLLELPEIFKAFVENAILVNYNPQTYVISSAEGKTGRRCNGRYTAVRTHNGRPLFKEQQSGAIMYWDDYWKINFEDSTIGWLYAVPGSDGQDPPTGVWKIHHYGLGDAGCGVKVETDRD